MDDIIPEDIELDYLDAHERECHNIDIIEDITEALQGHIHRNDLMKALEWWLTTCPTEFYN